jgi:hypothetical protein
MHNYFALTGLEFSLTQRAYRRKIPLAERGPRGASIRKISRMDSRRTG